VFEKIKGIKKGTAIASKCSESTMNVVNYLISNGHDIKTNDTLMICIYFYCYANMISTPTNLSTNKFINYTGSMSVQAKDLLKEWLVGATGVYDLDEYINNLDNNYQIFGKEIKEEYSIPDGVNAFDKAKSFASEKVFKELSIYFKNDSQDFKIHIGKQLENMRISL
jgi:hypothetical protein